MRGISPKCWRTARTSSTSLPGLDLDLHPAIALGQVGLDGLQELDDRGIKADGQARLNSQADLLVDGAQQLGDGRVVGLSQQVPEGVLGAGGREPAAFPGRGERGDGRR